MKKLLLLLAVVPIFIVACSSEGGTKQATIPRDPETGAINQKGVKPNTPMNGIDN